MQGAIDRDLIQLNPSYPILKVNGSSSRLPSCSDALPSGEAQRRPSSHEGSGASRLRVHPLLRAPTTRSRREASVAARRDEPSFVGEHDGLDAVAEVEFGEYACYVGLDGRFGHDEFGGDFGVGEAAGDQ